MSNILIVDDSPTMRRMVTASLRALPDASFGEAGSGLEVLDFLRRHQAYREIPVIVLTTRGDEASRTDALAAGASLYLTKPFAPQSLAEQARALLGSHREGA